MKITLSAALIGLLAWDYSVAPPGESAAERFYKVAGPTVIQPAGSFLRERFREMKPVLVEIVHGVRETSMSHARSQTSEGPESAVGNTGPESGAATRNETKPANANAVPRGETASVTAPSHATQVDEIGASTDDLSALLDPGDKMPFPGRCAQENRLSPSLINSAITAAGRTTSSSLNYLVHVAILESRLKTYAQASTSTAAGLFQFTKQTWLAMLKRHGAAHGLDYYANAITNRQGRWAVADPKLSDAIFGLRQDPTVAAVMAAELAKENAEIMQTALGRAPSDGELYAAHFLGGQDAVTLIRAEANTPTRSSALLFPDSTKSNPWIFHTPAGKDRSVSDLYRLLTRKPSALEVALFCKEGYRQPLVTAKS